MPYAKYRKFQVGIGQGRAGFVGLLPPDLSGGSSLLAAETLLDQVTVPAGSLYKNGQGLAIRAFGSYAANGNNKQIKLYANAVAIFDSGALVDNGKAWMLEAFIVRTAPAVQTLFARLMTGTPTVVLASGALALDETIDQVISTKGTAATANADILSTMLMVEVLTQ